MKIKEYYERVCAGDQVRANLAALRAELKDEKNRRAFAHLLGGDFSDLCALLDDADPKVRKNAALILGEMESEDLLPILFDAYQREQTLFVRADYLKALARLDCSPVLEALQERLAQLREEQPRPEEQKHVAEELRALQAVVLRFQKREPHRFTGYHVPLDIILVTNRCQREATARQVPQGKTAMLAGGLRVRDTEVAALKDIRTYHEMLFPVDAGRLPADDARGAGEALAGPVLELARKLHQGAGSYLFRIELKSRLEPEKKGVFLRRISDAAERASGGDLINSVSDYELEIRLLERKDGTFAPMVRFCTIPDTRFAYRREVTASSISPVNAALTAELARPYLKEGAQILDPFCGVGTMLIERHRAVRADVMYGIDVFGEAIEKARANTERAHCSAYYINRDFFGFEHKYQFDEMISDLPQVTAGHSREQVRRLYQDFFACAGQYLKPEAVLILYTTEPQLLLEAVRGRREYRIAEQYTFNEKNGTGVFIIER